MTTYTTLSTDANYRLKGVPQPVMTDVVRRATIEFCRETLAYRFELSPFAMTSGQSSYTLTLPTDTEMGQVIFLSCDGGEMHPVTNEQLYALDSKYPTITGSRARYYTTIASRNTVRVQPVPSETLASAFRGVVAVIPTLTSTDIPDWLANEWKDAIGYGTIARLTGIAGQEWSDGKVHNEYMGKFWGEIRKARASANTGGVRQSISVQLRQWV